MNAYIALKFSTRLSCNKHNKDKSVKVKYKTTTRNFTAHKIYSQRTAMAPKHAKYVESRNFMILKNKHRILRDRVIVIVNST